MTVHLESYRPVGLQGAIAQSALSGEIADAHHRELSMTTINITVIGCARCGETHEIEFSPFAKNAIEAGGEISTHWGICSNLNEPVLMRMEDGNKEETYENRDKLIRQGD